jgi:ferredoxin-NADP reductase
MRKEDLKALAKNVGVNRIERSCVTNVIKRNLKKGSIVQLQHATGPFLLRPCVEPILSHLIAGVE